MATRGRPNIVNKPEYLYRVLRVISTYHHLRYEKYKHAQTVNITARSLGLSESEVKRILSRYQSKQEIFVLRVWDVPQDEAEVPSYIRECVQVPENVRAVFTFGIGPRVQYARA
jgi:hypothetical protein